VVVRAHRPFSPRPRRASTEPLFAYYDVSREMARALWLITVLAVSALAAPAQAGHAYPAAAEGSGGATRTILASGRPAAAPGYRLLLFRTTVAPGAVVPAHVHPGVLVVYADAGELAYRIGRGRVKVHHPDGTVDLLGAGGATTIRPGDSRVERRGLVHGGRNRGTTPSVSLVAALVEADKPLTQEAPAAGTAGRALAGGTEPIATDLLGEARPGAAPGYRLRLMRFTFAPGAGNEPHTHPGMQLAYVEAGALRYTVLRGEVRIRRASGEVETLTAGHVAVIEAGDWFVEKRGLVHFGRNAGSTPLVLAVVSLFEADEPLSSPVPPSRSAPSVAP
jgi:quercetin dioxygenase-like cupin family protein